MTIGQAQRRFTLLIAKLIVHAYENGWELTFGEAYRTKDQQVIYIQQGKSQTMNSRHLSRLAVDFNLFINGKYMTRSEDYEPLGTYWESLDGHCVWGGRWKSLADGNHFEFVA